MGGDFVVFFPDAAGNLDAIRDAAGRDHGTPAGTLLPFSLARGTPKASTFETSTTPETDLTPRTVPDGWNIREKLAGPSKRFFLRKVAGSKASGGGDTYQDQ
ncbi:MAG: hypothetical protein IK077_13720 [Thermoguttaceae bacterium]|nr:hypothetical protein [Thermoguttaceae bacterium]